MSHKQELMAMLDLYKLQVFAQVAQAGSFSAAAEQLYMTQPAVSQHMQDLEASLGTQLFQRGRRGVTLTPEGKLLLDYTARVLKLVVEAEAAITDVTKLESGRVVVGATPGVSTYLMPHWLHDFRDQYPRISVSLQTATTPEIVSLVLANQIELGFVEGEMESSARGRLELRNLCDVPQLFVVGPRHPLRNKRRVDYGDMHEQSFVMRQPGSQTRIWIDDLLRAQRVHPLVIAEFDNPEAIKRTVMNGLAIAVLPQYAVQADVKRGALHVLNIDAPLTRLLSAVWNKSAPLSPVARAFISRVDACLHDAG
jgi:DNA-binding transcriptional LysR family regulator